MSGIRLDWTPPGPVSAGFMNNTADSTLVLNGPVGSGKTTTVLMKGIRIASAQRQSKLDGFRKVKMLVVRDTYRQLWATTMQSWFRLVPQKVGTFLGGKDGPATHRVHFRLPDGTVADMTVEFIAIGENAVEDVLRGYEPTMGYLNEADLLAHEVYTHLRSRIGRYPGMSEGGPSWHGIMMDCNAPTLSSWMFTEIFNLSEDERKARGIALYRQPSGLSPEAENLANLPPNYYQQMVLDQDEAFVQRMVHNRPGFSREGKPVYSEFSDLRHVSEAPLSFYPQLPLILGLDAGLNPAAVAGQRLPDGRRVVLDELVGETGTGATRFGEMLAQRLHERFPAARQVIAWADPSAAYGVDRKADERSWIEIIEAKTGIRVRPAPTNNLVPRLDAVRRPLTRLIDGKPAFLLDARCRTLREGFVAGYRFKKRAGTSNDHDDTPEKNRFSHPHDALQYLCLGDGEFLEVMAREGENRGFARQIQSTYQHEWDPLGGN